MSKKVFLNKDSQEKLINGMDIVADIAGSTLGAAGKTVFIASGYGHPPIATKDGVTVVKSISLYDEVENAGAMLMREAAQKTLDACGDGTTTSTVLAQAIIKEGLKQLDLQVNPQKLRAGIEKAVAKVVENLKSIAIPVSDKDMLNSVATISANNDSEIGGMLADAYDKIGHNGLLTIEKSFTMDTYVEVIEGSEYGKGWENDKFVTDDKKMEAIYEDPLIFVFDYEIKSVKEIEPFLMDVSKIHDFRTKPCIIVAHGFEGEPYNTMVVNKIRNGAKFCLIGAPTSYRKEALRDLAVLTGATLICDEFGMKVEQARLEHAGTCKKIVVSKSSTIIQQGDYNKETFDALIGHVTQLRDNEANPTLKDIWDKRLARLSGSIGVIYVGGVTDLEQKERNDRVDDANRAVRSATEEGVVSGGGIALMQCVNMINSDDFSTDEIPGLNLVKAICSVPAIKMLDNAGMDVDRIMYEINTSEKKNWGYDIKGERYCDMIEGKILDPVKVVRCALENASSLACQVITAGGLIVEMRPE